MLKCYLISDKGMVRENNEDNYCLNGSINKDADVISICEIETEGNAMLSIADGMGGHKYGEVASKIAVDEQRKIWEYIKASKDRYLIEQQVRNTFGLANKKIISRQNEIGFCGTTCTSIIVMNAKYWIYHIGDTRIYLFQNDTVTRLTQDHTLARVKVDMGIYSENTPEEIADRSRLIEFLGRDEFIGCSEYGWFELNDEDIILLCSDGLYSECSDDDILKILRKSKYDGSLEKTAMELLHRAYNEGAGDNITIALLKYQS